MFVATPQPALQALCEKRSMGLLQCLVLISALTGSAISKIIISEIIISEIIISEIIIK
jgi:hypothetical protein